MSTDETALLAAVAADPANDLPRLVYADWLDDHDQPVRAEFIRLQCEIARLEVGPRAVVDANWRLWKRQQDLLDDHLPQLLADYVQLLGTHHEIARLNSVFRRGFLDELVVLAGQYGTAAAAIARLPLPLSRLAATHAAGQLDILLDGGRLVLDQITELDMTLQLEAESDWTDPDDGDTVCVASDWPRLRLLNLSGCEYGPDVARWFPPAAFPALHELDLSGNNLSDAEVIGLLNIGRLARLTHLRLDANPIGDQAAFELADRLGKVATFRTLDFRRTRVTSAGQAALTAAFGSRCNLF